MNENETVQQILNQAKIIRDKNRTSCVELQNYLFYQYLKLENKGSAIWACGLCTQSKTETKKQFRRAFKTLNKIEQAQFYLMNVKNVQRFLNTRVKDHQADQTQVIQSTNEINEPIIKMQFQIVDNNVFKKFTEVNAQILTKEKIIRISQAKEDIDLQAYILRKSKNKNRNGIVLQAMEPNTQAETIRIVFSSIDFEDSYNIIFKIWNQAQYEYIKKILAEDNKFPRRISNVKLKQMKTHFEVDNNEPITTRFEYEIRSSGKLKQSIAQAQKIKSSASLKSTALSKIQRSLVPPELIQSLNTFKNFQQQSFGVYFERGGTKVRKVFQFSTKNVNIQILKQAIDNIKHIRRRKPTIVNISHLNSIPSERTNLYREINSFENKQYQFLYFRHHFNQNNAAFFFQKSIDLEEFKSGDTIKGLINYCIWKIMRVGDKLQAIAQADISYSQKVSNPQKITALYIGQFENIINKLGQLNKQQIENDKMSIGSREFQHQYLSQISMSNQEQDFFTVAGSLEDSQQVLQKNEYDENNLIEKSGMGTLRVSDFLKKPQNYPQMHERFLQQDFGSKQTTASQVLPTDYLKHRYQLTPKTKGVPNYFRQPQGHVLWGHYWKINHTGDLVNMEKQKIKVQSSVLKLVLQRMGKNILTGKSIMNTSLPIEIFGIDSNLERIARGYIYTPMFLEKAVQCSNPIERMKYIFCCQLGFTIAYIKMQKPFNPVLGETYQGIINGCPVYAQQISHHPPISSMLMIGRGYRIYGHFQSKVELGMNTASGLNDGYNYIEFTHDNSRVKFNTPPGQMQGIIMGERKIALTKKSYLVDETNRLLVQLHWGKNKHSKRQQCQMHDFFCGKIVKIKSGANLYDPKKIKPKDIQQQYGQIYGRFTGKIYYEDQLVFDVGSDCPFQIQDYSPCLESDSRNRNDIKQRRKLNFQLAQQAKQEIQKLQRHDKKLRKH